MPGITDVSRSSHGVAVRGETFGQCIDAIEALDVDLGPGHGGRRVRRDRAGEAARRRSCRWPCRRCWPRRSTPTSLRVRQQQRRWRPNCAIADVRPDSAEIWASLKSPIVAQQDIAAQLGLPIDAVTVHVTQGGGSFGRHLFHDAALEAARDLPEDGQAGQADVAPHRRLPAGPRAPDVDVAGPRELPGRQRAHATSSGTPACRPTSVTGSARCITSIAAQLPVGGNLPSPRRSSRSRQPSPYNFGVTTQLLNEVRRSSTPAACATSTRRTWCAPRNSSSTSWPKKMGKDPVRFRRKFLKDRAAAGGAEQGGRGRRLGHGRCRRARRRASRLHAEYRGAVATLVEIDCRPETVNRPIPDGVDRPAGHQGA